MLRGETTFSQASSNDVLTSLKNLSNADLECFLKSFNVNCDTIRDKMPNARGQRILGFLDAVRLLLDDGSLDVEPKGHSITRNKM